jgi:hypothetical protein
VGRLDDRGELGQQETWIVRQTARSATTRAENLDELSAVADLLTHHAAHAIDPVAFAAKRPTVPTGDREGYAARDYSRADKRPTLLHIAQVKHGRSASAAISNGGDPGL